MAEIYLYLPALQVLYSFLYSCKVETVDNGTRRHTMATSIQINSDSFEQDVIARSHQQPVLVDFFATWCGPCQMLKPMLESLAQEYDVALVKIDIDQNPDLANTYRVEGVPDVRVCYQGDMQPGFVGVPSQEQIRALLQQYQLKSQLEVGLEAAAKLQATGDLQGAKQQYDQLFQQYPDRAEVILAAAEFLVGLDKLEDANQLLQQVPARDRTHYAKAQTLQALIQLKQTPQPTGDSDLDYQYANAVEMILRKDYESALPVLLAIVERDRGQNRDAARKAMLMIFGLLGDAHPLTAQYRKQLMMALY